MTVSDVRTEIILELGFDSSDTDELALMLQCIKSALRRLPARTRSRCLVGLVPLSMSAGAQTATLPDYFVKERSDRAVFYLGESGDRITVNRRNGADFTDLYSSGGSGGCPEFYRIYGRTFELNRPLDQARTIYLDAFKDPSLTTSDVAVADDDELILDSRMIEPMKDIAKYYRLMEAERKTEAAQYMALGMSALEDLDDEYMDEELGDHIAET